MSDDDFGDLLQRAVTERIHAIMAHRERYVAAWVAETGSLPSESELVQRLEGDGTLTLSARRRARSSRRRVCVESPLKGEVARNVLYADCCQYDSLTTHGEAPYLGHLLYTRVLDDSAQRERDAGISAHLAWLDAADLVAVYTDLGITDGMRQALELCEHISKPVAFRSLGADWWRVWPARLHATPDFFACRR